MGESRILVDNQNFEYEGAFTAHDLFALIQSWFWDRGWDQKLSKTHEFETPTGKAIEWYAAPWKKITDYTRLEMKITVLVHNMVKKKIKVKGKETMVDHGKILINLNGYIEYDYDKRWDERPMFVFLRTIMNKYVYAIYTKKFEQILIDDVNHIYHLIQKFFKAYNTPLLTKPPSTVHQKGDH